MRGLSIRTKRYRNDGALPLPTQTRVYPSLAPKAVEVGNIRLRLGEVKLSLLRPRSCSHIREVRMGGAARDVIAAGVSARLHSTYIVCTDCRRTKHVRLQESGHAEGWRSVAWPPKSDPHGSRTFRQSPRAERALPGRARKGDVRARLLLGCRAQVLGIGRRHPCYRGWLCRRDDAQSDLRGSLLGTHRP